MEAKYGNAPIRYVRDTVGCYHHLTGVQTLLEQKGSIRQWDNKSIVAENRMMLLYDKTCKPFSLTDLTIWDVALLDEMQQCEDNTTNRTEKLRKEKLKDL